MNYSFAEFALNRSGSGSVTSTTNQQLTSAKTGISINENGTDDESRPINITVKYWKRID